MAGRGDPGGDREGDGVPRIEVARELMDGFIRYMKRDLIWHNIFAAIYAVSCLANLIVGLEAGFPWGVLSCACSFWMGHLTIKEAQHSKMAAKILDQARLQKRGWEEEQP